MGKDQTCIQQQLIDAIIANDPIAVKFCLEHGAKPSYCEDIAALSPIHYAAIYRSNSVIELLIMAGADISALTEDARETALDIARRQNNPIMIKKITQLWKIAEHEHSTQ